MRLVYLIIKDIFRFISWIPTVFVMPIVFLVTIVYMSNINIYQQIISLSIQTALGATVALGGYAIKNDIGRNLLQQNLHCKLGWGKLNLIRNLSYTCLGIVPSLFYTVYLLIIGLVSIKNFFLLVVIFMPALVIIFTSLGSLVGILFVLTPYGNFLSTLFSRVLMVLGGIYVPPDLLPDYLKWITYAMPFYWLNQLGNSIILDGMVQTRLISIVILILFSLILMCWYHYFDSLHKENIYLNKSIIGIDLIIQEMVEAKYSGVSFINKRTGYCLSEFILGQGELLVSGDVTPIRCACNNLKYPNQFDFEYSNQQSLVLARLSDLENRLIGEEVIWQNEKGILLGKDLFNVNGYLTFKQFKIDVNMEKVHCNLRDLLNSYDYDLDVEWAIDHQNTVYILQVRPQTREVLMTNIPKTQRNNTVEFEILGESVSKGVSSGELIYVDDSTTYQAAENKILYCESFDPQYTHLLAVSKGLITIFGGYLSHGAIVSREMYKPSIQNISINDFKKLRSGLNITLDADHSTIFINNSTDFNESSSKVLSSGINSSFFFMWHV